MPSRNGIWPLLRTAPVIATYRVGRNSVTEKTRSSIVLAEREVADHAAGRVGKARVQLRASRIRIQSRDQHLSEIRIRLDSAGLPKCLRDSHSRCQSDGARAARHFLRPRCGCARAPRSGRRAPRRRLRSGNVAGPSVVSVTGEISSVTRSRPPSARSAGD